MRRLARLTAILAAAGVAAVMFAAAPAMGASGSSPQQETQNIQIKIPQRVGIRILNHPTTLEPGSDYPTDAFPYWVRSSNFQIQVFSNLNQNFVVTVKSSAALNPYNLYIAAWHSNQNSPSNPSNGEDTLPDGWQEVGTSGTVIIFPRPRTYGWETYYAALLLKLSGDEPEASTPITLTYTIAAAM